MSLQQLYETVIREEEYIMEKRRDMREEFHSEFMQSDAQYCYYCLELKGAKYGCCGENHWGPYRELPTEDQDILLDAEVDLYDEWSRK